MGLPPAAARALDDLGRFGVHLGLGHVRRLLAALGDPHLSRPTFLVAGTNGKGSTAALLAAMATAAGLRTGLYTSPHLEHVEERVRLDGVPADGDALGDHVLAVLAAAERLVAAGELDAPPTYFEALTAAAALAFRDAAVDLAVLEVGLGGRLDATNAAEPVLSVITAVALDHREVLGDTLTAVASEKAGVLRAGRPAVAWGGDPEVRAALAAAAGSIGARLTFADRGVAVESVAPLAPVPWGGLRVVLSTPRGRYELDTPLAGRHQAVNLALAVRAAERLGEVEGMAPLPREAIVEGAASVRWPGRLERVELPAADGLPALRVLLDAAHNPAGAATLAAALDDAAAAGEPAPVLLFGVLADKDAEAMLPLLARRAGEVVLTRPPGERGRDPEELLPILRQLDGTGRSEFETNRSARGEGGSTTPRHVDSAPERALATALDLAAERDGAPVVICGSIFLVGALRSHLRATYGVPRG